MVRSQSCLGACSEFVRNATQAGAVRGLYSMRFTASTDCRSRHKSSCCCSGSFFYSLFSANQNAKKKEYKSPKSTDNLCKALQTLEAMCNGLREDFAPSARLLLPAILEKLREKKAPVIQASNALLDAMVKWGTR